MAGFSNAFKNLGIINDAVASEPICKNSLRLKCMVYFFRLRVEGYGLEVKG